MAIDVKTQHDVTLIDILVDGFEKNEVPDGTHWRQLPMPDEASAIAKFASLVDEGARWQGKSPVLTETGKRRKAAWDGLDIRQTGLAIHVRVKTPWFNAWWHDAKWDHESFDDLYAWLREEEDAR
jgi:hypothetical protein